MKEITLSLLLTLPEYDTLLECVADELHRSEVFAGQNSALAATCSSLLEKIKEARRATATCATCFFCEPWQGDIELCQRHAEPQKTHLEAPACADYTPHPASHD